MSTPSIQYWISRSGVEEGPFTETQLRAMWLAGTINGATSYWRDGLPEWAALATLADLLDQEPARPVAVVVSKTKPKQTATGLLAAIILGLLGAWLLIKLMGG